MAGTADFVIVGAGIIGLSLARELKARQPACKVVVLDKETGLGRHASGRNSGVLHSGIYYAEDSLKARVCAQGAREMAAYCDERALPIGRVGKVIVPVHATDDPQLDLLLSRARSNGARALLIDRQQLSEVEPAAHTITGRALHCPDTAVVDPLAVLNHLAGELREQGVEIRLGHAIEELNPRQASVRSGGETIAYGHLFNSAGLHADRVAQACGIGRKYTILPFKGIYYKLSPESGLKINGLIYPVPDLNMPFLGVHFTRKVNGDVYLGPTAVPAFSRENYAGLEGVHLSEAVPIAMRLLPQYWNNKQGFRQFAHQESGRFLKQRFVAAARALVPGLQTRHVLDSDKVGIRAQLLDTEKQELVMDFLIEHGDNSTHVLNAVSPAFTCAFAFSRFILDNMKVAV